MLKEEIRNIKESKKDLRKFGITVGVVLLLISSVLFVTGKAGFIYFGIPGILLTGTAVLFPAALRPVNKVWMTLALILGWFMTRVILSILFYLILTPIGLIAKAAGKHFLDLNIDKSTASYWIKRDRIKPSKTDYERQF